jgi:hypothetical protein
MKKTILKFTCVMFAVFTLASCATRVQLHVQRTPALDTAGIQRIAIMPFGYVDRSAVYQSAARHATTVATGRIQATNHFTLVSPSFVNDVRRRGEGIENYVDAFFTGQIMRITENTSTQQTQHRDRNTGATITRTYFVRDVEVEFTYFFERQRDGTLIGPITRRGTTSDSQENKDNLASVNILVNRVIENQLRNLHRDVAPHTITISRSLVRENNRDLRPQMEAARAHVRGGNYMAARQAYLDIWVSHQSVAAAVNASILFEAMGETRNAANFMQQVLSATGSPLARETLARLNSELAEQARVGQFDDTRSPVERVTRHAISEVQKVLPIGARLWIYNNETSQQNFVNAVVDNMIVSFLNSGVTVIERQMIDLVLREQNFHLGGNVSDDDFVSIGNLAGANVVVVIGITGTGAVRRLQVRVLDIRAGTVIMQSGTGSEWNL